MERDINTLITSDENTIIKQIREKAKKVYEKKCPEYNYNYNYNTNTINNYTIQSNSMENLYNSNVKTSSNINTETMNLKSERSSIQNQRILADPF